MKFKIILLFLLLTIPLASAATIYSYLENINSDYIVLVEDTAPGSDSLAATDIVTGIQRLTSNRIILQYKLVSESAKRTNLILIGHPCDNKLIPINCDSWSYKEGEALIRISGSNLIVSGTTPDDTRRAAKIIANYKDYPELKQKDKIIVKGTSLELPQIQLQEQKPQTEMVCGDGICEAGEICEQDCKTCDEICIEQENLGGVCRSACQLDETLLDKKYCKNDNFCCCLQIEEKQQEEQPQEEESWFRRLFGWLIKIF